jgi:type II secretory pathway component PulF
MEFAYEAVSPDGSRVRAHVEASGRAEAADALRGKGLFVVKIEPRVAAHGAAAPTRRGSGSSKDLLLFMRQMKMLLESGAPLVPALLALEQQAARDSFRSVLRGLREKVEGGATLSEAMGERPELFPPIVLSMVAAGESTATLSQSFSRLADLAERQTHVRRTLITATAYPMLLCVMLTVVIFVLLGFVIPRFSILFDSLQRELPPMTRVMIDLSALLRNHWPAWLIGAAGTAVGLFLAARSALVRSVLAETVQRLPLIGRITRRLNLACVMRIWAALLRSHVPLLDTIRQSRDAVRNEAFHRLLDQVAETVSAGGRVGKALGESPLVEPVLAAAIATGEENARLADAVDFVSTWLDDENDQMIAAATRLAEPLVLAVMGVIVGAVALALFIPLFDVATAAGH